MSQPKTPEQFWEDWTFGSAANTKAPRVARSTMFKFAEDYAVYREKAAVAKVFAEEEK